MAKKVVLLNDLCPEMDEDINGEFYDEETMNTGVVYEAFNVVTGKSYIWKGF